MGDVVVKLQIREFEKYPFVLVLCEDVADFEAQGVHRLQSEVSVLEGLLQQRSSRIHHKAPVPKQAFCEVDYILFVLELLL